MLLKEVEEWHTLRKIESSLYTAVSRMVEEKITGETPLDGDRLTLLQFDLRGLNSISVTESDQEINENQLSRFQREANGLFELARPILQRLQIDIPSLQDTQKLPNQHAPGDTSTSRKEQTEVDSTSLEEALSLSQAESLIALLSSLNKLIRSLVTAHSRKETRGAESRKLNPDLYIRKQKLIDGLVKGLGQHTGSCESGAKHLMLLKAAGRSWRTEDTPSISLELNSCQKPIRWQEIECSFDRDSTRSELGHKKLSLCQDIARAQKHDEVLKLLFLEGTLYKSLKKEKYNPQSVVQMKTLKELIEKNRFVIAGADSEPTDFFKLQEKKEMALNICWCFLYLFGCPWAHGGWSAENISFPMSTDASSDQLELHTSPYILCDPECASSFPDAGQPNIEMEEAILLDLGKLLAEMELGKRVTIQHDNQGQLNLRHTIDQLLCGDDFSSSTTDAYLGAIEGCVYLHKMFEEMTPEQRAHQSGNLIYDNIVANLEKDFAHYRPPTRKRRREASPAMDLDLGPKLADALPIRMLTSSNEETGVAGAGALCGTTSVNCNASKRSANNGESRIHPEESVIVSDQSSNRTPKRARIATGDSITTSGRVTVSSVRADSSKPTDSHSACHGLIRLFDELESDTATVDHRVPYSHDFLKKMDSFNDQHVSKNLKGRVKVCIIDTGIDMNHPSILLAKQESRLGETISFIENDDDINDECGHGTNVAELLLRVAPKAALYVAKIAVTKIIPKKDIILIAKAVE